ncbi:hypothetical protein MKEN_00298800 [Mycena kentingensis (nom. inval.)]|nr:hypothetical protein MKEN_00298800 [Mycena kentingensis (nom. inval.)]
MACAPTARNHLAAFSWARLCMLTARRRSSGRIIHRLFTLRRCFALLATFVAVSFLLSAFPEAPKRLLGIRAGPLYLLLRLKMRRLPQHNLSLPFPEGKTGRYVRFRVESNFIGWNNCLNERLMNAHLAYATNRAYTFSDYWWPTEHYPFKPWPEGGVHTPSPSLLGGPVVGGSWGSTPPADLDAPYPHPPRAILWEWFDVVCPPETRRNFTTGDVKPTTPGGADASGLATFQHWRKLLLDAPERCVEISAGPSGGTWPQIFGLELFGGQRVLDLWDEFSRSPVSTTLRPSPLVHRAVEANLASGVLSGKKKTRFWGTAETDDPFPRMLAFHLRRGDYIQHCQNLLDYGAGYYGWAQLPFLPDVVNQRLEKATEREARMAMCLPDVAGMVRRIEEVSRDWQSAEKTRKLEIIYLLTNESGPFLGQVVEALGRAGRPVVVTTRNLHLTNEQFEVSMAVDMEIAKRAAVFVGNGWSSFTSNVIHQRLVAGHEPASIRHT